MDMEKDLSTAEAVALLRQLADALEKGGALDVDGTKIKMPKDLEISLEFEEEDGASELEIEINWTDSPPAKTGKFEIFPGKDGKWYTRLKATNGQVILTGNSFATKEEAEAGVEAVKKNAVEAQIDHRVSKTNQAYFVLNDPDGGSIGKSQMYKRKVSAQKGARSVLTNAPSAEVVIVE
ncbi:MAG TPA: amphi-Trp domain-containing protein [Anaerolineae bacterium]|nr:amphi-Trp domain-containing protein [Anaerolineae bacterium]